MESLSAQIARRTVEEFQLLLPVQNAVFPELEAARHNQGKLANAPQTRLLLKRTQHFMQDIGQIPLTGYTAYDAFLRNGERLPYETPYFLKRSRLAAAALRLFLGQAELRETVQDYLWNICEETNWVLPAHQPPVDLFAAETGLQLAETLSLLADTLDEAVRRRVHEEIERRVFQPYMHFQPGDEGWWWYQSPSNWNGVCNGSVAATFLLLERDPARLKRALEIALGGLQTFVEKAFEEDGSSTEGVSYWQYGLLNFITLAEFLYARSGGAVNLLAGAKMRAIAAFPAKLQLSGSAFASFADCDEQVLFHPGILTRLAERTGERSLLNLLARPAEPEIDWRLSTLLRDLLWWDGSQPEAPQAGDSRLPDGGTARLVAPAAQIRPVVLCIKAGHNAEEHNHNDVGSFILHAAGENLLTDPGRGLYTRDYFREKRYENIFANSYGHSVPRIAGLLQSSGREFAGTLLEMAAPTGYKGVAVEFARAYACADLQSARRELLLALEGKDAGTAWLRDSFQFAEHAREVEEAFITWLDCEVDGPTALIHSQNADLALTIEQPQGLQFQKEELEEQSKANRKPATLKRLSVQLPLEKATAIHIKMKVIPQATKP